MDQPKRPWHRLHVTTWLACLLLAALLVVLDVPGDEPGETLMWGGSQYGVVEHGWPFVHLRRDLGDDLFGDESAVFWLDARAWQFSAPRRSFSAAALAGNVLVATALLAAFAAAAEWWRRSRNRIWQFSLKEMFGFCCLVAVTLAWWRAEQLQGERQRALLRLLEFDPELNAELSYGPAWLRKLIGPDHLEGDWQAFGIAHVQSFSVYGQHGDPALDAEFAAIRQWSALAYLNCSQSSMTDDDLARLETPRSLCSLTLSGTRITDRGLVSLARLPQLQELNLAGNLITDDGLKHLRVLSKLEVLRLSGTEITDAGVQHLHVLKNLKLIDLGDTDVTRTGAESLARALPGIEILPDNLPREVDYARSFIRAGGEVGPYLADGVQGVKIPQARFILSGARDLDKALWLLKQFPPKMEIVFDDDKRIVDAQIASVCEFHELKSLSLRETRISDQGLEQLRQLPGLQRLALDRTGITDRGLANLRPLAGLKSLSLAGTRIGDDELSQLRCLEHLESLDLSASKITDAGMKHLLALKNLEYLSLENTRVTKKGIAVLRGLANLGHVLWSEDGKYVEWFNLKSANDLPDDDDSTED